MNLNAEQFLIVSYNTIRLFPKIKMNGVWKHFVKHNQMFQIWEISDVQKCYIWHIRMNIRTCEWVIIYETKFNSLNLIFQVKETGQNAMCSMLSVNLKL